MVIPETVIVAFLTVVFSLIGTVWSLGRNTDAKQQGHIDLLFEKRDQDVERLARLELEIEKRRYVTDEQLTSALSQFMIELAKRFDRLEEKLDHKVDKG